MSNPGIDYGAGQDNINHETGIRYGCISQNSVMQAWAESSEPDYGEPRCPECGNTVMEADPHGHIDQDTGDEYVQYCDCGCQDYVCHRCCHTIDSYAVFGEPTGYYLDGDEYRAVDCLDSAILIIKSPFYTYAPFCSPCVPGAGDLNNAGEGGGVKTYCFSHDWFETGAPYPVYSVETGQLVEHSND